MICVRRIICLNVWPSPYHIPLSTTNKFSVERNAMREVRYCAIAHGDADGRHITHLYPVKSVKLKNRCDLSIEQTGRMDSEKNTKYWLFELWTSPGFIDISQLPVRSLSNAIGLS